MPSSTTTLVTARGCVLTVERDLPLKLQIRLVPDDDDGDVFLVLDAENLFVKLLHLCKGVSRGDGVDEQEALAVSHVVLAKGALMMKRGEQKGWRCSWEGSPVLVLACCVEYIETDDLVVDQTLLSVRVYVNSSQSISENTIATCARARALTLDGRIILVHKAVLEELDGERGFAYGCSYAERVRDGRFRCFWGREYEPPPPTTTSLYSLGGR
jgi:hypothetical protein